MIDRKRHLDVGSVNEEQRLPNDQWGASSEGQVLRKIGIILGLIALLACIGVSFQVGKNAGFTSGSEWAMVQADIIAQEAGVFMPVYLKDGKFRVVLRQPRGIYKRARELADQYEGTKEPVHAAKPPDESKDHEAKDSI